MKTRLFNRKLLEFIKTIFLIWFFLCLFKFFEYGFGVKLSKLFLIGFCLLIIYIFWETINNFQYFINSSNKFLKETKRYYYLKYEIIKQKKTFIKFSKHPGPKQILLLSVLVITILIVWDFLIKHIFKKNYLLAIFLIGIVLDIIFVKPLSDIVVFFIASIWIIVIRLFKFGGNVSLFCSFILLVLCILSIFLQERIYIDKTSVWIFVLLAIGIFQEIFFSLRRKKI